MIASHHRIVGSRRSSDQRASAAVEPLEPRRLLAGNVTAALDPNTGVFEVRGDNKANQVRLEYGADDVLRLIALNGTTLNGVAGPASTIVPLFANLHFDMGNGNDTVEVVSGIPNQVVFDSGLSIETSNGDDRVHFERLTFRPVIVSTGNGNDEVTMINAIGMTELRIDTGNGSDSIRFAAEDPNDPLDGVRAASVTLLGGNRRDTISGIANLKIDTGGTRIIDDVETIT